MYYIIIRIQKKPDKELINKLNNVVNEYIGKVINVLTEEEMKFINAAAAFTFATHRSVISWEKYRKACEKGKELRKELGIE